MPILSRMWSWALGRTPAAPFAADLTVAAIRVFAGLTMALAHGWGKLPVGDAFLRQVERMGMPAPLAFAWAAALTEFVGGLALAAGLATRATATLLAGMLLVILLVYHAGHAFEHRELALLHLALALFFAVHGGGRFAVDRLAARRAA